MEQVIINWIQSHISMIATWIISLGVVWKLVEKYSPKIKKYIKVSSEALSLLDTVITAIEDKKIDDIEVGKIRKEANDLMEALR